VIWYTRSIHSFIRQSQCVNMAIDFLIVV